MKNPPAGKAKAGLKKQAALAAFLTRPQAVYIKSAQFNYDKLAMKRQGIVRVAGLDLPRAAIRHHALCAADNLAPARPLATYLAASLRRMISEVTPKPDR